MVLLWKRIEYAGFTESVLQSSYRKSLLYLVYTFNVWNRLIRSIAWVWRGAISTQTSLNCLNDYGFLL